MITNLIQPDAPFPIEPGKSSSTPTESDKNQGAFATALQGAVNSDAPAKATSAVKAETQSKPFTAGKGLQSLQQMLVAGTLAPAVAPVPVPKAASPDPPISALPGKVGKDEIAQLAGDGPPATNDIGRRPTTLPLQLPGRSLGAAADVPSSPLQSHAQVTPGSSDGASEGFVNPADPLMRLIRTAPVVPVALPSPLVGNDLQSSVVPALNFTTDPSPPESGSDFRSVAGQVASGPAAGASLFGATPIQLASSEQLDSPGAAATQANTPLSPNAETATPATSPQPKASVPAASKPPRVLDAEARRIGELPLRDQIPAASMFPQVAKRIVNSPVSSQVAKVPAVPTQLKTGATAITAPVADSAKDSQESHLLQKQDNASSLDHTGQKGMTAALDDPEGPSAQSATPAPDSPSLSGRVDAQPGNLPAASVAVPISTATSQNAGNPALTSSSAESTAPHPVQTSSDAAAGGANSVQSARVVLGVQQAEMHIGFRSPTFGSVEVHTAVRDTQLGLAVSSEHGDLRGFLAQEVPALQNVFHQQGLQFDQIRFVTPSGGSGAGFSGGPNSNSNSQENGRSSRSWFSEDAAPRPETAASEIQISTVRLSVHA